MADSDYQNEIERLEKEREELLKRLSPEERQAYENFKVQFTKANHQPNSETPEAE